MISYVVVFIRGALFIGMFIEMTAKYTIGNISLTVTSRPPEPNSDDDFFCDYKQFINTTTLTLSIDRTIKLEAKDTFLAYLGKLCTIFQNQVDPLIICSMLEKDVLNE